MDSFGYAGKCGLQFYNAADGLLPFRCTAENVSCRMATWCHVPYLGRNPKCERHELWLHVAVARFGWWLGDRI